VPGPWRLPRQLLCLVRPRPSAHEQTDQQLLEQGRRIHRASRGTHGAPRGHAELGDDHGMRVRRKRVARLMRTPGWSAAIGAAAASPA
jgi:hypothetical protein